MDYSAVLTAAITAIAGIVGVLAGGIIPARIALRNERRKELHATLTAVFHSYLHFHELRTPETLADTMAALEAVKLLVRDGDPIAEHVAVVQKELQKEPIDFVAVNEGYALLRYFAWDALAANNPRGSWKIRHNKSLRK